MIKRICPRCGGYHELGEKCYKNALPKKTTAADRFRQTNAWKKKAEDIKRRDLYMCLYCKEQGRYTFNGLSVHHITPINEDYDKRLDDDNLITLCDEHHKAAERGEISKKELYEIVGRYYEPSGNKKG